MKIIYCFFLVIFLGIHLQGYSQKAIISIPKSTIIPVIDGKLDTIEWQDANSVIIRPAANWPITIFYKYDSDYLYVAFENLISPRNLKVTPEILIAENLTINKWDNNTYWFHSSYSNCEGKGEYYNWENCATTHPAWQANTFPYQKGNNNMEFKIGWSKLQVTPIANLKIGIAFKISDAMENLNYWPETAIISNPSSWGILKF